jgi:hypothetical protein
MRIERKKEIGRLRTDMRDREKRQRGERGETDGEERLTGETESRDREGQNLGRVLNSRCSGACIGHAIVHITKQNNLKLKTQPIQLLGYLPLAFALPV